MEITENTVVWITGASSGTGEAMAYAFSQYGARLILSARREEALNEVKNKCAFPEKVKVLPLDLEQHDELPQKAQQALGMYGKIDILFNNGGVSQRSLAAETDFSVDKRLMDINYFGAVILTKSVLPILTKQGSGHIAVMTSLAGKFGIPYRSAYAASKHALHGFFDSLRAEVYQYNIKVTLITSGYIKTDIAHNAFNAKGDASRKADPGIENGMPAELFAKKAVNAVRHNKQELLLGGSERFGVILKRFFPRILNRVVRNQLDK